MANDEEYLDNLLKSLIENEPQPQNMEEVNSEIEPPKIDSDKLADMLDELENSNQFTVDDNIQQTVTETEIDFTQTEKAAEPEIDFTQLEEAALTETEIDLEELQSPQDNILFEEEIDVTDFIDNLESSDEDLAEINGLLKKSDNNEFIDDDMLALLADADENPEEKLFDSGNEAFDIFAETEEESNQLPKDNIEEDSAKTKKKKREKRKKNKKIDSESKEIEGESNEKESEITEDSMQNKVKKPGFFSRFFKSITEEDGSVVDGADENEEILKELDEEDRKKDAIARKKSKKDAKKNQKSKNPKSSEADDSETEEDVPNKSKKKSKKEKKVKEIVVKSEKQKSVKVLTKNKLIVLVIFCMSLIAGITVMSIYFPDYADKKNAREAYYNNKYEEVYTLLYDKKLEDGDLLMFNKVKTVLQMERKLNSYQNYLLMEKPVEALDALLRGVLFYSDFADADTYAVRSEVDEIYKQICAELNDNYSISEEEAKEINGYDNETYTRKLISVVFGTEFITPGTIEDAEPKVPQDILPEEEDIVVL